jgi:hypothetical protein
MVTVFLEGKYGTFFGERDGSREEHMHILKLITPVL